MSARFTSDVDIDLGSRDSILQLIKHTRAAMLKTTPVRHHATGVYPTDIPYDPVHNMAAIDYAEAEERGYFKLDLLNVGIYRHVKNEAHLVELMREPDWTLLTQADFCKKLVHIGNYYDLIKDLEEPIDSIPRLAMFVALIRPGKKYLIGRSWKEISESIWLKDDAGYSFKRSHSVAYAHLIVVNMNLLVENPNIFD